MEGLERLLQVIDEKPTASCVFFRDDDAGWGNKRLRALCERFIDFDVGVDIAVIPQALNTDTERVLIELWRRAPDLVRFHQHGNAHRNHQIDGRKCEFGADRSAHQQSVDIDQGSQRLRAALGELVDPIFTPPWNRCTQTTVDALRQNGIVVLSRISGSDALDTLSLVEVSVTLDWCKKRRGVRESWESFCDNAGSQLASNDVIGVMLHHELMDDDELSHFTSFLGALRASNKVVFQSMMDVSRRLKSQHR